MKYPKTITKLLTNKTVFYIVAFFAIANILGYLILGNYAGVLLFLVIGGITYIFEKNKTFVLFVALIVTSILMMIVMKKSKEGLENEKKKKKDSSNIVHPLAEDQNQEKPEVEKSTDDPEPESADAQKDGMKNKKWGSSRIDHAATIEQAYGNLSQILGSQGLEGLTNDTKKLMKQQMELADAMKGMMPVVKQAQEMMKGFDLGELGGLADLAKQFTAGKTS